MQSSATQAAPPHAKARRRKTAKERRCQRLRAEARCAARLVHGLEEVHRHRGGALSLLGTALLAALKKMRPSREARGRGVRQASDGDGGRHADAGQVGDFARTAAGAVRAQDVAGGDEARERGEDYAGDMHGLTRRDAADGSVLRADAQAFVPAGAGGAERAAGGHLQRAVAADDDVVIQGSPAGQADEAIEDVTVEMERDSVGEAPVWLRAHQRARVRAAPSPVAASVGFVQAGEVVSGWLAGRWLKLESGGYCMIAYDDGEVLFSQVDAG